MWRKLRASLKQEKSSSLDYQRLLRKAGEPQGVRSGHFKRDRFHVRSTVVGSRLDQSLSNPCANVGIIRMISECERLVGQSGTEPLLLRVLSDLPVIRDLERGDCCRHRDHRLGLVLGTGHLNPVIALAIRLRLGLYIDPRNCSK